MLWCLKVFSNIFSITVNLVSCKLHTLLSDKQHFVLVSSHSRDSSGLFVPNIHKVEKWICFHFTALDGCFQIFMCHMLCTQTVLSRKCITIYHWDMLPVAWYVFEWIKNVYWLFLYVTVLPWCYNVILTLLRYCASWWRHNVIYDVIMWLVKSQSQLTHWGVCQTK